MINNIQIVEGTLGRRTVQILLRQPTINVRNLVKVICYNFHQLQIFFALYIIDQSRRCTTDFWGYIKKNWETLKTKPTKITFQLSIRRLPQQVCQLHTNSNLYWNNSRFSHKETVFDSDNCYVDFFNGIRFKIGLFQST